MRGTSNGVTTTEPKGSANGTSHRTLLLLGAGPGIGRSISTLFASHRYTNIILIARCSSQLQLEKSHLEEQIPSVRVGTYPVDITNTKALFAALDNADTQFGKPELVFFNAARVRPSGLLEEGVEEVEYDSKINVSALYNVAGRYLPHLVALAAADPASKPGLIATSSMLPMNPIPEYFALSLVKAAQRNLMQSLWMVYAKQAVHVGVVNVGGPVSEGHEVWNPRNIAERAWNWHSGKGGEGGKEGNEFEVLV